MSEEPASKRAKIEESGDYDDTTKKALKEIDGVQNEIDSLNEKASEEILKIEQKYNGLRRPFYEKRSNQIKNVPNFWAATLINHPQISAIVDENEEEALQALTEIEVEEFEDIRSGFKIVFKFKPNDFFENDHITKEYFLSTDAPSSVSTAIKWKDGKDLSKKTDEDNLSMSFFEWLATDVDPASDDVAEVIKDDIWPNPLQYFLVPELEEDDDIDEEGLEEVDDEAGSEGENDENA